LHQLPITEIDESSYFNIMGYSSDRKQFGFIVYYAVVQGILFKSPIAAERNIAVNVVRAIGGSQHVGHFSQNAVRI
jgi:hypothetical protein